MKYHLKWQFKNVIFNVISILVSLLNYAILGKGINEGCVRQISRCCSLSESTCTVVMSTFGTKESKTAIIERKGITS